MFVIACPPAKKSCGFAVFNGPEINFIYIRTKACMHASMMYAMYVRKQINT